MKPTLTGLIATTVIALLVSSQSGAIIVRGDAPVEDIQADPSDHPAVVALLGGRAVGTLIADRWILTAAHVGQHIAINSDDVLVTIAGEPNRIVEAIIHPSWNDDALGAPKVVDIALLRLAEPAPGAAAAPVYEGRDELNAVVTLFGWGRTGDGQSEELVRDGRFRRGENRVDEVTPRLRFRFDEPGSDRVVPLEAVSGPGDSGGPAFIEVDDERHLAGISSFQEDYVAPGIFGVVENYERVSDHVEWIKSTIAK